MIRTKGLGMRIGEKVVLRDISFSVEKGEIFGLIGPSGAGKSTLLKILDLLVEPSEGSFTVLGEEVTRNAARRHALRQRMAMLLQKPLLFKTSVNENIGLGLRFRKADRADIDRRVARALRTIGLAEYGNRRADTLSGGEAQRVALARAMVTEPEILFLDEPTANLDPHSTEMIEQLVVGMNQELGTTIILSTHDMLQGQRIAHRIGVIMDGSLQQTGTTRTIFYRPETQQIAQFVGIENMLNGKVVGNDRGEITIDLGPERIHAVSSFPVGAPVTVCFRGEDVTIHLSADALTSARNMFSGTITRLVPVGPFVHVTINCGFPIKSLVTLSSIEGLGLMINREVWVSVKATALHVLGRDVNMY